MKKNIVLRNVLSKDRKNAKNNKNINKMNIDLRTPLQKQHAERNQKIYQEYLDILKNAPSDATKWSIWRAIGEKFGLKPAGVRSIITKMETNETAN